MDVAARDVLSRYPKRRVPSRSPGESRLTGPLTAFLLAILLAASEVLYLLLLRLNAVNGVRPVAFFLAILGAAFALYFVAYFVLRNGSPGFPALAITMGGTILFRVTLLPAGLPPDLPLSGKLAGMAADWRGETAYERFQLFDDDIWRYLWDGHVAAAGRSPYASAPADAALDDLVNEGSGARPDWETIRENINYPRVRTVYPPFAQMVFRAAHGLAPGSVVAMKGIVVAFDLLAYVFVILTLAGRQHLPAKSILYGWNPLVIKVFAGSGHVDAVLVAALAATCYFLLRKRQTAASVSLGLAIAAKLAPIVLLPFLARRVGAWRTVLVCMTALACYLPYFSFGAGTHLFDGLLAFSGEWRFNGGPYRLFECLIGIFASQPQLPARAICAALIALALFVLYRRDDADPDAFARVVVMALGAVLILSPVVMPWYVTWLLPAGVVAGNRVVILCSLAVSLAFLVMVGGVEWAGTLALEYAALGGMIWWEIWRKRSRVSRVAHAALF